MLTLLVGVTGLVTKSVINALKRGGRESKPESDAAGAALEERLRKLEAATSSLVVDMSGMREKQRFMARLGESSAARHAQHSQPARPEDELSPLVTQNIPIIPRADRTLKY